MVKWGAVAFLALLMAFLFMANMVKERCKLSIYTNCQYFSFLLPIPSL